MELADMALGLVESQEPFGHLDYFLLLLAWQSRDGFENLACFAGGAGATLRGEPNTQKIINAHVEDRGELG